MGRNLAIVYRCTADSETETLGDDTYNGKSYWTRAIVMPSPNLTKFAGYFANRAMRERESESTGDGRTDSEDYLKSMDKHVKKNSINVYLTGPDQLERNSDTLNPRNKILNNKLIA